ncbi:MAG: PP2C family protein-serine/threonine phosphatase [Vicinamibacterales bacterium]
MIQISLLDLGLLIVVACMLALGVGATVFGTLRPRVTGRPLILFGAFSCAYGTRVASGLSFMPSIPGLSPELADTLRQALTYVVLLPLILLVEQFIGRGWRGTMRATVWLQVTYTAVGVLTAGFQPWRAVFQTVKPYIVLLIGLSAFVNILLASRHVRDMPRSLLAGFLLFIATVGVYNVGLIIGQPALARVEIFGYVPLVMCLGFALAVYVLQTEARLLLIDREVRAAQRIQAAILPDALPEAPGVTISARYRPMNTMAGDFYDMVRIDDQRVGILVADALGHGLAASLIAAMVKVAFSAEVPDADEPGAVLTGMNRMLVRPLGRDREFVTAVYVVFDHRSGQLAYARAGHPPPLLLLPDGGVRPLDDGGTILGKFAGVVYEKTLVPVPTGGRLLLYTDGVTEAMNPDGEGFGLERLTAELAASASLSPDHCADALLNAVTRWRSGTKLDDDVTLVVVDLAATHVRVAPPVGRPVPAISLDA